MASVDSIVAELRDDQVYVADGSDVSESAVRGAIGRADDPLFVVALDDGADVDGMASEIGQVLGVRPSAIVVLSGDEIDAAATAPFQSGEADRLAESALASVGADDPTGVLIEAVEMIDARGDSLVAGGGGGGASDDGGGGGFPWLLVAIVAGGAFLLFRRRRKSKEERAQRESQRRMLRAEVAVLASDVMRLEPSVRIHPEAEDDYQAAVSRYRVAEAAVDDERVDPVRLERVIDEARYSMARAEAVTEGREPPAPPEKLRSPGSHGEPALETDEQGRPIYVGHPEPYYGGGGWFGGGGFFNGLLLGQILGGWGWGGGMHHHHGGGDDGGGFGGGWGDFGGGDGGGWGDFGGGDFGGGGDF